MGIGLPRRDAYTLYATLGKICVIGPGWFCVHFARWQLCAKRLGSL
jgi:hypothetical protein